MRLTYRAAFAALLILGLAVLGYVLFSQYVQGYQPCEWCLRERIPWAAVIALGIVGLVQPSPVRLWLAGGVLLVGAAFGFIHFGIEQNWWETGCSVNTGGAKTIDQLRMELSAAPACNIVRWRLFGLSMATYNLIVSLAGSIAVFYAARELRKQRRAEAL